MMSTKRVLLLAFTPVRVPNMTDLLTSPGRQSSRLFAPSYPSPLRNATRFAASGTSDRTNDGGLVARPSEDENKRLNRLKKDLKIWERSFVKKNGREPTTEDISIVPEMGMRLQQFVLPFVLLRRHSDHSAQSRYFI